MNSEQRQQIRDMVKMFSSSSTESLIAFVAETDSMLAACQALLQSLDATGSASTEWLQRECSQEDVIFHEFLQELTKIVALFQTSRNVEDHYAILEVSADASLDEIKQAYRTLSRRYHPDTALPTYRDNPEKFIAITKAYQALLSANSNDQQGQNIQQENQWRRKKVRTITPEQRKKVFTWALGLFVVFMAISIIASMNFKKRAMLAGLKESRGAFIPPARKISEVSTGKGMNIDHHPTERQPVPSAATKTPVHELVTKVEQKPEVDFFNGQAQESVRKESGNEVAAQASIAVERRPVKQLVEVQPNRAKEKTQFADAAHPSVLETTATPKPSENFWLSAATCSSVLDDLLEFLHALQVGVVAQRARLPGARDPQALFVVVQIVAHLLDELVRVPIRLDLGADLEKLTEVVLVVGDEEGADAGGLVEAHVVGVVL